MGLKSLRTSRPMVSEVVCQPLAAKSSRYLVEWGWEPESGAYITQSGSVSRSPYSADGVEILDGNSVVIGERI